MEEPSLLRQTPFAVKTNILYDEASFVNFSVEAGLGSNWGVQFDAICPWWKDDDNLRVTQMINLGLEGRYYWRGWTDNSRAISGPYVGAMVSGGIYDLCRRSSSKNKYRGFQGDYFFMGGITCGYVWAPSPWWRLEASAGLGAMQTAYTHYDMVENGQYLMLHNEGTYTYFGPTKINFSIAWLFSQCWQQKKKGVWR
ncbi:MAG: DUF3575 domain-containing protein [Bacteroidales bacterium]|nr:DUF3575 domain-containing protein [Candidatus Liminaster caballi]